MSTLRLLVCSMAILASLSAPAFATPAYYDDRATYVAELNSSFTDDYEDAAYVFIQADAAMSGVKGETEYQTTGFANLDIVQNGGAGAHTYCAGCNGSFRLTFTSTSLGTALGIFGVGVDIDSNSAAEPYRSRGA